MKVLSPIYRTQYRIRRKLSGQIFRLSRGQSAATTVPVPSPPERVLFVLAGLIGDSVMCTPTIIEARRAWPRAHFTILGGRRNRDLLSGCPLIDSWEILSFDPFSLRSRRRVAKLRDWISEQRFDIGIALLGDQFSLVLAQAGIPVRVGVLGDALSPCSTHLYDIGTARGWGPSERINALRCLGLTVSDVPPRLWPAREAVASVETTLRDMGLGPGESYAVLHPFGSTRRQWWGDAAAIARLARRLDEELGLRTVLMGASETSTSVHEADRLIDLRGKTTLAELVALVDRASLVVSTDSGPFHVAGALGRPLVGLFRSSRPEHRHRYPNAVVVLGTNSECDVRCDWDVCRASPCFQMGDIEEGDVLHAAMRMVGRPAEVDA